MKVSMWAKFVLWGSSTTEFGNAGKMRFETTKIA
jgi:hypothetical protein